MMKITFEGEKIDRYDKDEGLKNDFTTEPFSLEQGFQRLKPEYGTNFCNTEVREREAFVAPYDPQPVEGGFLPRNNIFNRM